MFSVRQDPFYGRTATQNVVGTCTPLARCGLAREKAHLGALGVGRVRSQDFLSILRGHYPIVLEVGTIEFLPCRNSFSSSSSSGLLRYGS